MFLYGALVKICIKYRNVFCVPKKNFGGALNPAGKMSMRRNKNLKRSNTSYRLRAKFYKTVTSFVQHTFMEL